MTQPVDGPGDTPRTTKATGIENRSSRSPDDFSRSALAGI